MQRSAQRKWRVPCAPPVAPQSSSVRKPVQRRISGRRMFLGRPLRRWRCGYRPGRRDAGSPSAGAKSNRTRCVEPAVNTTSSPRVFPRPHPPRGGAPLARATGTCLARCRRVCRRGKPTLVPRNRFREWPGSGPPPGEALERPPVPTRRSAGAEELDSGSWVSPPGIASAGVASTADSSGGSIGVDEGQRA